MLFTHQQSLRLDFPAAVRARGLRNSLWCLQDAAAQLHMHVARFSCSRRACSAICSRNGRSIARSVRAAGRRRALAGCKSRTVYERMRADTGTEMLETRASGLENSATCLTVHNLTTLAQRRQTLGRRTCREGVLTSDFEGSLDLHTLEPCDMYTYTESTLRACRPLA